MNQKPLSKQILFASLISLFLLSCSPQLGYQIQGNFKSADESVHQESEFVQLITPYKEAMDEKMGSIIGVSTKALTRQGRESLLGNFVTDLQREYAQETFGYEIDISIINNGGMRNDLPEGNITLGNIYELSPFDNYLVILELQSEQVIKLAEFMAERKNMSVSGMTLTTEDNKLKNLLINGKKVEDGKTYLLAINDYLANGGDNMEFLKDLPIKENSSTSLRDMLKEVIESKTRNGEKLTAEIEGRLNYN